MIHFFLYNNVVRFKPMLVIITMASMIGLAIGGAAYYTFNDP